MDETTAAAAAAAITISAKKQIKFLCSHGGKILPRPADGQLKYVGGETRLISVPTDISFQQLMQKLCLLSKGEMILKYQVVSEDLDALVSVKSEEDVVHMFDEINNWENARRGSMLRAFLFVPNPNQTDPLLHEQRYVDAINGIFHCSSSTRQYPTTVQHSSVGSSPSSSPESCTTETTINYGNNQTINMHKVRSMPNICGSYKQQQQNNHHIHQIQHQHYQSDKLGALHLHTSEKLASVRSGGHADGGRYQLDQPAAPHYNHNRKQTRGNGHCMKCLHSNDNSNSSNISDTRLMVNGTRSRAMSPVPSTTRLAHALG